MKKLVLTTLTVVGVSSLAFAQGYVAWNVIPGSAVIGETNAVNYSSLSGSLGGGANASGQAGVTVGSASSMFYYELLYSSVDTTAPTTLTDLAANWTASGLFMNNATTPNGRLAIPASSLNSAAMVDPSYNQLTTPPLSLMLVGWSANLGTTFAGTGGVLSELQSWAGQVTGAFFGESVVGSQPISTTATAGTTLFNSAGPASGFIYNPSSAPLVMNELATVPEPGTLALAALGGLSMLMFRRKK
jgi:hypothetical protein